MRRRSCLTNPRTFDNKAGVDVIYFDFKKPFDCVPHLRMLHKFNKLGISGRPRSWIQSFLIKRTPRVKAGLEGNEYVE